MARGRKGIEWDGIAWHKMDGCIALLSVCTGGSRDSIMTASILPLSFYPILGSQRISDDMVRQIAPPYSTTDRHTRGHACMFVCK